VGRLVVRALRQRGFHFRVIEEDPHLVAELREVGIEVIRGLADNPIVLERVGLDRAAVLVVALADPLAARAVVGNARRAHARLPIVARTTSASEREILRRLGANEVVVGELELGLEMTRFTLRRLGVSGTETAAIIQGLRGR
jgi:CPA2 family monovalent cation:H+ antiporter-2